MNDWRLPSTLTIHGREYPIRTDYRAILDILAGMNAPELDGLGKNMVVLRILFPTWRDIPTEDWQEALTAAGDFIDHGAKSGKASPVKLMDWEQDAPYIIPAINAVAHTDIRGLPELHWWTFIAYFMEIRESTFSTILHIRQKRSKGKKLEKWEKEYLQENRDAVLLHRKMDEKEKAYWDKWL